MRTGHLKRGSAPTAAVIALAVVVGSCSKGTQFTDPNTVTGPQVLASNALQFTPVQLSIDVGQSVTWTFGSTAHTVVFTQVTGVPSDIPATKSDNVSRLFTVAGQYNYICTIHTGMHGTILVAVV